MADQQITTEDILKALRKVQPQAPAMPAMEGANIGLANFGEGIKSTAKDIFARMKKGVTEGPGSSKSEFDPRIGLLGPEMMLPAFGRALGGLGAVGGRIPTRWTPQMQQDLREIHQSLQGTKGIQKETVRLFREKYPGLDIKDNTIQNATSRLKTLGGLNEQGGAISSTAPLNVGKPGGEFELGAFGGRGRLTNSELSAGHNMEWLQAQKPVDQAWVKNWAKEADVPITSIKNPSRKATYIELEPLNHPRFNSEIPTVRVPKDYNRHSGHPISNSRAGSFFDTGYGNIPQEVHGMMGPFSKKNSELNRYVNPDLNRAPKEIGLVNEAGMSYAHPEALDAALKWRLHKAPPNNPIDPPGSGNWLIPEEMAPRLPTKSLPEPPKIPPDPRQLKLLSGGFTPAQILEAMKKQQESSNGP